MKAKSVTGVWQVRWGDPYTRPPNGQPEILAEEVVENWHEHDMKHPPEYLVKLAFASPGYSSCWSSRDLTPRRTMSKEAKSRIRIRNMERRMRAKYPLFADVFIHEALAKRPAYYAAEKSL